MEQLTNAEQQLMEAIWEREELSTGDLVRLCAERFGWKKSTTYTNLKRLTEKGMVYHENALVKVRISQSAYRQGQRSDAIRYYFSDSLPQFLVSFLRERKLDKNEIAELERIIAQYKEDGHEQ